MKMLWEVFTLLKVAGGAGKHRNLCFMGTNKIAMS